MMYPRLKLARNLLTDDGVIFISIDDNEVENLKKVCNEIFGEENFINTFVRKSGVSARLDSRYISIENDYILLYSKNSSKLQLNQKESPSDGSYKLKDNHFNQRGGYKLNKMDRGSINYSKSLDYPIKALDNSLIYPGGTKEMNGWCWRWSKEKFIWGLENDFIVIKESKNGWSVYFKQYESVDNNNNPIIRTIPYKNMLIDKFFNEYGNRILKELFGSTGFFDYSKPVELIIHLLKIIKSKNSILLDFFSGSATTAHAVMNINKEDNGNRKFIMVQLPEPTNEKSEAYKAGYKTIAEIGKERIRRAGDRILKESDNKDLDIGFKVFKLDSSNLKKWDPDYKDPEQAVLSSIDNIKEDRTEFDLLYEIMLKYGIDLTLSIEEYYINNKKVYSVGFGALLICLDDEITSEIATKIIKLKEELSPETVRVVFKDNGFKSDSDKTNIKETLKTNGIDEFITI
ncbi:MAG: DNA methylase [Methanobrevibacter sp. CfCl-M3]